MAVYTGRDVDMAIERRLLIFTELDVSNWLYILGRHFIR